MPERSNPELALEAVKVLIWPLLAVIAVLWLNTDLRDILKNRKWKAGSFEVGERISSLDDALQDELLTQKEYLDNILANPADVQKVREYADKAVKSIENAQKGIKKEVRNIQEAIPEGLAPELNPSREVSQQTIAREEKPTSARGWEALGFQRLLDKRIDAAIEAFSEAEKLWPDYHNVSEIRALLIREQGELAKEDSPRWKELYKQVAAQFSWGMPSEIKREMQKRVGG